MKELGGHSFSPASHFPQDRNSRADAVRLWEHWRLGLVKHEAPRSQVSVTHGQPDLHWKPDGNGALCINLESMWDDYEHAVGSLMRSLESDVSRRADVLKLWEARTWTTRPFYFQPRLLTNQLSGLTRDVAVGSTMGTMRDITATGQPPSRN